MKKKRKEQEEAARGERGGIEPEGGKEEKEEQGGSCLRFKEEGKGREVAAAAGEGEGTIRGTVNPPAYVRITLPPETISSKL